jgi:hypothetical protein
MDLGLAFSFPFQDEDWVRKILVMAVIGIIPIFGWLVWMGWSLEVARRVIRQDPQPLPDYTNLGEYFVDGIKGFIIALVLSLPIIIVSIPFGILGAFSEDYAGVYAAISICFSCFALLYGLVLAVAYPAAFGVYAATNQIGDAVNPGKLYELIKVAPGPFILAALGVMIAGIVGSLGTIACGVGVLATTAYANAVNGHLFGQAYNQAATTV